ncbi:hypothetical protein DICPUDRAFT_149318 [Dictyostelium purpureum]|uniref:Uncharacterized protein n=1 Tax=Dictyostelium purpureum TaxID=5786 RepID=F0ZDD8_DICPU|nr:uncharacterized protein DICPUDRAFT_149318 [Dictyostelium purpureum]EGC38025.1 hypothetical protein DICPUDRAFT_149318 [Dictyostelium purpureum]|eukprot:XP_003285426.1 hypothetical protein DICPUDRAFT_149318 [Dictyostelium purpureum]
MLTEKPTENPSIFTRFKNRGKDQFSGWALIGKLYSDDKAIEKEEKEKAE